MSDLTVILDRKELVVRMESKSIRVDRSGGHPERIPLGMVARVAPWYHVMSGELWLNKIYRQFCCHHAEEECQPTWVPDYPRQLRLE